jgi:hypothetical protein
MMPSFVRDYALTAIAGAPDVLEQLVKGIALDDPRWDYRPDPERFTLREIVGHLADWNGVYFDRITRIRDEEMPSLLVRNPEEVGRVSGSFQAPPDVSLAHFRAGRAELAAVLGALELVAWKRTGEIINHPSASGAVSIEAWNYASVGHDGYHLQQVAQWLNASQENK